jgi:hypothetical protein
VLTDDDDEDEDAAEPLLFARTVGIRIVAEVMEGARVMKQNIPEELKGK